MDTSNMILYGPRDKKSLTRSYPELAESKFFKDLSGDDLLFAWFIGIPFSPCDHKLAPQIRHSIAAERVFTNPKDKDKKDRYAAGQIPEDVQLAIDEFAKKSPEARSKAKLMAQTVFNNWQKLIDVDIDKDFLYTNKDGDTLIDFTARKQYIDSTKAILEALPASIKQLEEGFGITDKKTETSKVKSIDRYHENQKGKSS